MLLLNENDVHIYSSVIKKSLILLRYVPGEGICWWKKACVFSELK